MHDNKHKSVKHEAAKEGLSSVPELVKAGPPPVPPYTTKRQQTQYERRIKKQYNKDMLQPGQAPPTYPKKRPHSKAGVTGILR